jgi:hypothetical protein
MFFTRTQRYRNPAGIDACRTKLLGKHLTIHDLDFEVQEHGKKLRIIPHAEKIKDLRTLPITDVIFNGDGANSEVVVKTKIRRLDYGGPLLIMLFCGFLVLASCVLLFVGRERMEIYTLLGVSLLIYTIFWYRMRKGYYDYVRKISDYIRNNVTPTV